MDVLCTDKTGTLTQDRVILKRHLDVNGNEDEGVLNYAYLNSRFQSGLKNLLDIAVQQHAELEDHLSVDAGFRKLDEIPFDFTRRRLSVVVQTPAGEPLLICKGAVEEILTYVCNCQIGGTVQLLDEHIGNRFRDLPAALTLMDFVLLLLPRRPTKPFYLPIAQQTRLA